MAPTIPDPGIFDVALPDHRKPDALIFFAREWIGFSERGGDNRGQAVERFQKAVDGRAQGEPWCASFAWFCIEQVDRLGLAIGGSPEARLYASEHVLTVWNKSPKKARIAAPEPGCLVLWQYHKDGRATSRGHVGIVTEILEGGVKMGTVEGNTGPGKHVVREGDGVYEKIRYVKSPAWASMKIKGFLKPWF